MSVPAAVGRPPTGVLVAVALAATAVASAGPEPKTVALLYLAAVTPALVISDLSQRRLPNRFVLPGIGLAIAAALAQWAWSGVVPFIAAASGLGYFVFLLALSVAGGMGMGDVKLGAALGLLAGLLAPQAALLSPVLAFGAGGVAAVIALARQHGTIAFGPYLLGGFWVAVAGWGVAVPG